jgi:N-formylglutamate amidohydrolase
LRLEDRHVDQLGAAVAAATGAPLLRAHAPRAMMDLNRAESDIDWEMIEGPRLARPAALAAAAAAAAAATTTTGSPANHRARSGLGLIPRRLPGYGEIWRSRLPRAELDRRIAEIHQPYHQALGEELRRIRDIWGAALLVDLHSMPPLAPRDSDMPAPVMVLGDRFGASCHHALVRCGLAFFEGEGVAAAQNRPYSGGYVLDRHGAPASGIHAIQIEVCRSLYLDDDLAEVTPEAPAIAALLTRLVVELGRETAALGQARAMMDAAE